MVNVPNVAVKGLGVNVYSNTNRLILEENIENILKEGYQSTFMFGEGEYENDMAENFAKTIAGPLSKAIDSYVKNMIKSQNIIITPATLISPVGPVTGVMTSATDIKIS